MILDKVDLSSMASAFKLRGYSSCAPVSLSMPQHKGPDAASREKDMFERAKQRRRADAEQARIKRAKQEARNRIRQFEDQRRNKEDFEIFTPKRSSETAEVDSAIFVLEEPKHYNSHADMVSKIVSKWRAKARWSKALRGVRSMSSGSSNISPSGQPAPMQPDLLVLSTPTRTRASSTSSMKMTNTSPRNSDASLLNHSSSPTPNDLLSPFAPRRPRGSSTDSTRLKAM